MFYFSSLKSSSLAVNTQVNEVPQHSSPKHPYVIKVKIEVAVEKLVHTGGISAAVFSRPSYASDEKKIRFCFNQSGCHRLRIGVF